MNFYLFRYYRRITIDNTQNSNDLTDYQILITLDTESLISAEKMRSDCADIRFFDSDRSTELNYWIESGINTNSTKIWIKVPNIPANSKKTIYLCYGNPNATSLSNGDLVFDFFDDFLGTSLDTSKWTLGYANWGAASVTVSNSLALIRSTSAGAERAVRSNYVIYRNDKKIIEAKVQILSTDKNPGFLFAVSSDNAYGAIFGLEEDYNETLGNNVRVFYVVTGSGYRYSLSYNVRNDWFVARITKYDTYSFEARVLDLNYNTLGRKFSTTQTAWNYDWWICARVLDTTGFYWDWVRVRKYAYPEPTVTIGQEYTTKSGILMDT